MKKLVASCLLLGLFVALCVPVHASVKIQAVIDQSIHVVFDFDDINSTIWSMITSPQYEDLFNSSTIPKAIKDTLEQRNLTNVHVTYSPLEFNYSSRSIRAAFYLYGSDILNFTFNKTTMAKIYYVRTDWRKFYVNFTDEQGVCLFSLNFTEYFGIPVYQWRETSYTLNNETRLAYSYNYTGPSPFDPICYFILPVTATNVKVVEDTIIFELPPALGDVLLNSPFLILGALIIVNIAFFLRRRIRR